MFSIEPKRIAGEIESAEVASVEGACEINTCKLIAKRRAQTVRFKVASIISLAPIVVLAIPFVFALVIGRVVYGISLTLMVWVVWCTRGIDTLVVYSDSPIWQKYMIESVISKLRGRSIVLNWSERRHWHSRSLPVVVFRYFGGNRECNPMVVVFRPLRLSRTFRFWQPFRDCKHGNNSCLHDVENQLYTCLGKNPHSSVR